MGVRMRLGVKYKLPMLLNQTPNFAVYGVGFAVGRLADFIHHI
jgi:hypothetical protein